MITPFEYLVLLLFNFDYPILKQKSDKIRVTLGWISNFIANISPNFFYKLINIHTSLHFFILV